jgi:F0F1-type ATP synthase assembly protein I
MEEPPRRPHENDEAKIRQSWIRMSGMVVEFVGAILVLGYIGLMIDERYGCEPWGSLAGFLLGTAGGLYLMVRAAERLNK